MTPPHWRPAGPIEGPAHRSLEEALRLIHRAKRREPTETDAPPVSTLPMTKAARTALRMSHERPKKKR